jgi:hypothetical protein
MDNRYAHFAREKSTTTHTLIITVYIDLREFTAFTMVSVKR